MGFERFAEARSIAVVGASPRNLIARITLGNLRRRGFRGRIVGVHPSAASFDHFEVVPSIAEAEAELALLAVGAHRLPGAVREAGAAGTRALVLPGAGANEGGGEVERELRAAVDDTRVDVIGPNCMGFASLHDGVVPYVGTLDPDLQRGNVAFVSQSGSVCELFTALPWRIGFSHVISVGNELGVDLAGAIEYLIDDERTRAVGVFVEGVRRPDAFRAALRAAAERGKPVVALKVGRSETSRAGTVAHTGVLAGDDRAFSAVLRDAGAVEVRDLDEMLAALELLGKPLSRPPTPVLYVGDSGGQANLFADLAADHEVELATVDDSTAAALRRRFPTIGETANPLDLWAIGDPDETYRDGVRLLLESQPDLVLLGLDKFLARAEPERSFVRAAVDAVDQRGALVLMAFAGGEEIDPAILPLAWERGVPVTRGAGATLRALGALGRWGETAADHQEHGVDIGPAIRDLVAGTETWTEYAAKRLLEEAGIHVTREVEVASEEEAVAAAERLGYPVVLKASSADLSHKTESGGVRLHRADAGAVAEAARALLDLAPRVLVAEQLESDLELVAGAFVDEQFGPCAVVGLGGMWTEALGDAVVIAAPFSPGALRRTLETRPWGRLLARGARGRTFPVDEIWEVCARLVAVIEASEGAITTIEINPLFLGSDRAIAVDALVVPAPG